MASTKGIEAGRAFVSLFADDSKLVRGLRKAEARVRAFGSKISGIGRTMTGLSAAVIAPLAGAAKHFASYGDQMGKMAKRTGLSVEALSALKFAAERSGTEISSLENGIRRMQATTRDAGLGLSTAVDALADLNMTAKDFKGLSPEQQFKLLADRISQVEDPSRKAAIAMKIFGRAGTQLLPMMANGAKGIDELMDKAKAMGLVMSKEDAIAAEALTDAMGDVWAQIKMVAFQIGSALAPNLKEMALTIRESVKGLIDWVKENRQTIVSLAKMAVKVGAVGVAVMALGKVIVGAASVVGGLRVALTALAAHPVLIVTAAIVALAAAIQYAINQQNALNHTMKDSLRQGDIQRQADIQRIARLKQLAAAGKLSASQMKEAARLIATLRGRYGEMGLSIDQATGKITGMAHAQYQLNKALKQAAILELESAMQEHQDNIAKLQTKQEALAGDWGWNNAAIPDYDGSEIKKVGKQIIKTMAAAHVLRLRLKALRGGYTSQEALTGTTPTAQPGIALPTSTGDGAEKQSAALVARLKRRSYQLDLQQIKDKETRAQALLWERYNYEYQLAKKNAAAQKLIYETFLKEKAALAAQYAKERETAKTQQQGDVNAANVSQAFTIAELELRARYKGVELERKLLALQKARAVAAAKEQGISLEAVEKEFSLREKLADIASAAVAGTRAIAVSGTFNAARASGMGVGSSVASRTATATEETAATVKKQLAVQKKWNQPSFA